MSAPSSSVVPLPSLGLHNAGNAHASPLSGVACPIAAPRSQYEAWLQALSESERSLLEAGLIHPPPTMAAVAPSVLAREVIDVDADQSSSSAISISNTTASEPVYQPAIGSRRNPSNFARPVRRRSEAMSDDEAQPPRRPHAPIASGSGDRPAAPLSPDPPASSVSGAGLTPFDSSPPPCTAEPPRPELSAEQRKILDLVVNDEVSLFFTGSAGTGKSTLLNEIIYALRKKYCDHSGAVAVTASTGIAATHIEGRTVHSFAGIGYGQEDVVVLVEKIRGDPGPYQRWKLTKVLIIDEISMIGGNLFDKLSEIACRVRGNDQPFGGIQVVAAGDFFQLAPVPNKTLHLDPGGTQPTLVEEQPIFAFEAAFWPEAFSRQIELTNIFRQRDPELVRMLNEVRVRNMSEATIEKLKSMSGDIFYSDGIEATEISALRYAVASINGRRLDKLDTEEVTYDAVDDGDLPHRERANILDKMEALKSLRLKIGAQVMLICNLEQGVLVNGTVGKVIDFVNCPTYEGERHRGVGGGSCVERLMCPGSFTVEDKHQHILARRRQVPLILAWATTIHKSQGQTLYRLKCDVSRAFAHGHVYSALSRATCLETMQIIGFDVAKVILNERVTKWSTSVERLHLPAQTPDASPSPST